MHFWINFFGGWTSIFFLISYSNGFENSYRNGRMEEESDEPVWIRNEKTILAPFSPEHRTRFPDDSSETILAESSENPNFRPVRFSDDSSSIESRTNIFPSEDSKINFAETVVPSSLISTPSDDALTGEVLPDEENNREEKVLNLNPQKRPTNYQPHKYYYSQPLLQSSSGNYLQNPNFNFGHKPNYITHQNKVTFLTPVRKESTAPIMMGIMPVKGVKPAYVRITKKEDSGRHFKPQTLLKISETLGALNTVGRFLVNMTSGIETPSDEVPTAIYTISKNVLGPNVTDTIAPFVLSNVNGLKINLQSTTPPTPSKDARSCTTPDDLPGFCDDLSACPQLLLNLKALRESICFKNSFVPGVCCPGSIDKIENLSETTITTTTTKTTTKILPPPPPPPPPPTTTKATNLVEIEKFSIKPTTITTSSTTSSPLISSESISVLSLANLTKPSSSLNGNIVNPKDCGQAQSAKFRVVGGEEALPGRWPWMAAIFLHGNKRTEFWCGGSLITAKHILTAAHCTRDSQQRPFSPRQFTVRLGDIDLKRTDEPSAPVTYKVKEVKAHPQFSRIGFYNDIAILVLDKPVIRSRYIIPLCLPPLELRSDTFAGQRTTVVGWGTTFYGGKESTVQRQAILPIWRNEDCDQAYFQPITTNFICAGYSRGGVDACQGDSGGPLMLQHNARWIQVGVVSFGNKCGEPGYPGVYTRITEYLDWIEKNTKD